MKPIIALFLYLVEVFYLLAFATWLLWENMIFINYLKSHGWNEIVLFLLDVPLLLGMTIVLMAIGWFSHDFMMDRWMK